MIGCELRPLAAAECTFSIVQNMSLSTVGLDYCVKCALNSPMYVEGDSLLRSSLSGGGGVWLARGATLRDLCKNLPFPGGEWAARARPPAKPDNKQGFLEPPMSGLNISAAASGLRGPFCLFIKPPFKVVKPCPVQETYRSVGQVYEIRGEGGRESENKLARQRDRCRVGSFIDSFTPSCRIVGLTGSPCRKQEGNDLYWPVAIYCLQ